MDAGAKSTWRLLRRYKYSPPDRCSVCLGEPTDEVYVMAAGWKRLEYATIASRPAASSIINLDGSTTKIYQKWACSKCYERDIRSRTSS